MYKRKYLNRDFIFVQWDEFVINEKKLFYVSHLDCNSDHIFQTHFILFQMHLAATSQNWFPPRRSGSTRTRMSDTAYQKAKDSDASHASDVSNVTTITRSNVSNTKSENTVSSKQQPPANSALNGSGEDVTESAKDTVI